MCIHWLMSISLGIQILLIFGPLNTNTLKKLEYEYIFFKIEEIHGSKFTDSQIVLLGVLFRYPFFLSVEYEYNYPVRDMDLSPHSKYMGWTYDSLLGKGVYK